MTEFLKNKAGIEILTDTGWSSFSGMSIKEKTVLLYVQLETTGLICTFDHKIFTARYDPVQAKTLRVGMKVLVASGVQRVVSVTTIVADHTYDLTDVEKNNRFYANGVLVSNCKFLIFDETLISPLVLAEMSGIDPVEKMGQIRWYKKPVKGQTYAVALDPSLGTGGDYAAIQVLELPSLIQVAEWQHNKTPIQQQVKIVREITQYIYECIGTETDIYYSVENNTLGEAALLTISEIGEENIRGIFMTEPSKPGQPRRGRKGFTTTSKSKLAACAKFKQLVEQKKIKIASKNLVSELKNFVASAGSYAAKVGETDDLVMSMLLAIRIAQSLQNYDVGLDAAMRGDAEDFVAPMPFVMI